MPSVVYQNPILYELVMRVLYGRYYTARYRTISELIPPGADVVDLCCGPGTLYWRFLQAKGVTYRGLDINSKFVKGLTQRGVAAEVRDLREDRPIPAADYVIMQGSLYHFLPQASSIVDRMLDAARSAVIITEPVRNLAAAKLPLVAHLSKILTDPGSGVQSNRFTEETLDILFQSYSEHLRISLVLPGKREKLFLFDGKKN